MPNLCKIVLSVIVIVLATASAASARGHARCRMLPAGPEWYLDDTGCWHSIRADWAGIERRVRARRLSESSDTAGSAGAY